MKRIRLFSGFSLVELLISLSIIMLLAMVALPAISQQRDALSLRDVGMRVAQLLMEARQSAISRQQDVFVVFTPGRDWCVAASIDPNCICGQTCFIGHQPLLVSDETLRTTLASTNFPSITHLKFDSLNGLSLGHAGHFLFTIATQDIRVIVSNLGRIRLCAHTTSIWGVRKCV